MSTSEKEKTCKNLPRKVYIRTYGCQMNERDTELIEGMFIEKGYEIASDEKEANVILFNTCSVRQHAEDRVAGSLRKIVSYKKKNPLVRIGVVGCMAQRHGELLFKQFPYIDMVVGPNNIYDMPELIAKLVQEKELSGKTLAVNNQKRSTKDRIEAGYTSGKISSAYVNIMYGCNNYCSYCIVPYVRGKETSRPKKDIVDEIKLLIDKGVKEITLLGQNVNSYGQSLASKITFPALLEEINSLNGLERIRFITSHPKDADKSLFRAIQDLDKVCEHLHLPLQSASNRILDLMNRKYTYEDYKRKIDLVRGMIPDVGLSTDIIVGFPSEKEADFEATCKALGEIKFDSAFIFKYSPRPPAASSSLVDDVPAELKNDRNNILLALQKEISYAKNKALVGTTVEILAGGKSHKRDEELTGRTCANTLCVFSGEANLVGRLVLVRIKDAGPYMLKGEAESGIKVKEEEK